jgi:hypothetical protein
MDGDDVVPFLFGHVEDHAVSQDAGHVDEAVDAAEAVDTGLDDVLAALHGGDGIVIGDGGATGAADGVHHLVGGALVRAGAVLGHTGVVHHHFRTLGRRHLRHPSPNTPSGAGHQHCFAV